MERYYPRWVDIIMGTVFFLSENIDHIPQYDRTFTDPCHSDHSDRSAE